MDKSILREVFTWGTTLLCLAGTLLNVKKSVFFFDFAGG
jgi:hypothetical protein